MDATRAAGGAPEARSLEQLRAEAARDPRGAARQAAVQFESIFTQMVLKSMRDATPAPESAGPGGETFTAMLDTQFSKQMAGRPGGLADMLEKQLTRHLQNLPAPGSTPAPPVLPSLLPDAVAPTGDAGGTATPAAPAAEASPARAAGRSRTAAFLQKMLPHAQEAERQTGVPASFILGQAALESGWGKGEIRNADGSGSFNLFGIKATPGWKGAAAHVMTTEFSEGRAVRQKAAFRSYGSYSEAFADYARLLANNPRYAGVVRGANTAEAFAGGMQRAGYATDPQYADKLARTIHQAQAIQRAGLTA